MNLETLTTIQQLVYKTLRKAETDKDNKIYSLMRDTLWEVELEMMEPTVAEIESKNFTPYSKGVEKASKILQTIYRTSMVQGKTRVARAALGALNNIYCFEVPIIKFK